MSNLEAPSERLRRIVRQGQGADRDRAQRACPPRRAADATDALAVDGTAKPAGAAETAVAAAWGSVVQEINNKLSVNARR